MFTEPQTWVNAARAQRLVAAAACVHAAYRTARQGRIAQAESFLHALGAAAAAAHSHHSSTPPQLPLLPAHSCYIWRVGATGKP